jgi:hypothetical protein
MDWKRGSSNRAPALQGQSPELKPQSQQKKKKKKLSFVMWMKTEDIMLSKKEKSQDLTCTRGI